MLVCHEPGCNQMKKKKKKKKAIHNFRCGAGHIKFQNYVIFKRSPVPCLFNVHFFFLGGGGGNL